MKHVVVAGVAVDFVVVVEGVSVDVAWQRGFIATFVGVD